MRPGTLLSTRAVKGYTGRIWTPLTGVTQGLKVDCPLFNPLKRFEFNPGESWGLNPNSFHPQPDFPGISRQRRGIIITIGNLPGKKFSVGNMFGPPRGGKWVISDHSHNNSAGARYFGERIISPIGRGSTGPGERFLHTGNSIDRGVLDSPGAQNFYYPGINAFFRPNFRGGVIN